MLIFVFHLFLQRGWGNFCSGNQTRAPAEGQVEKSPLDEDNNAALELDNVHQVNE